MQRHLGGAVACSIALATAPAHAGPVVWPELSYSMALTRGDGDFGAHFWIGAGVSVDGSGGRGTTDRAMLLGGVEIDLKPRGNEVWVVSRLGLGMFRDRAMAPLAAYYLLGGGRTGGPDPSPHVRLGVGLSLPGLIDPLALIGIPTMFEIGVDFVGDTRGFFRLGWNF